MFSKLWKLIKSDFSYLLLGLPRCL